MYFTATILLVGPVVLSLVGLAERRGIVLWIAGVLSGPGSLYIFGGYDWFLLWGLSTPACFLAAAYYRPRILELSVALVMTGILFPIANMLWMLSR